MSMSDPIADLLTRLRNGLMVKHSAVKVPASNVKEQVCAVLKREGFIEDYTVEEDGKQGMINVTLKYMPNGDPVIQGLRRVSKPSLRAYARHKEIAPVRSGLGVAILTTSKGVMTGKEARHEHVGGEVLCEVW